METSQENASRSQGLMEESQRELLIAKDEFHILTRRLKKRLVIEIAIIAHLFIPIIIHKILRFSQKQENDNEFKTSIEQIE